MSLADLPVGQGMRLRGVRLIRLENFVDAAFAWERVISTKGSQTAWPLR